MTDLQLLNTYLSARGMPADEIARVSGIKPRRLKLLLAGKEEFKASEMLSLCRILDLTGAESEKIFFGEKE